MRGITLSSAAADSEKALLRWGVQTTMDLLVLFPLESLCNTFPASKPVQNVLNGKDLLAVKSLVPTVNGALTKDASSENTAGVEAETGSSVRG